MSLGSGLALGMVAMLSFAIPAPAGAQAGDRMVERWLARAEGQFRRGRTRAAAQLWRRCIAREPGDWRAPVRLAETLLPDRAAHAAAEPSAEMRRDAAETADVLMVLLGAERPEALEPAVSHRVHMVRAWAIAVAGDHRGAIEAVALVAGRMDTPAAMQLRRLAALAVLRHDLEAAVHALGAAQRADPVDLTLLTDEAAVELGRGRTLDAIRLLREALHRQPEDESVQRDLAGALLAAGYAAEALDLFAALALEHADDAGAHLSVARAALEAGRAERAERAASVALRLGPERDPEPALVLAAARLLLGRRDAARDAFREALRRQPGNARAREGLRALD